MCGISGFNWEDKELGQKMSSCLVHRGPDASGIFTEPGITLAHKRLSIIDLAETANQPMHDSAGNLVIIFNGEIYNYLELRDKLQEYKFKTQSDTEVILAGYLKYGKDVVHKLNGIFSFAIWDRRDQSLFLARDHMGVKPLYYHHTKDKFVFASEVSSILTHDIPRKLDLESFNEYLRVLYVPEPRTMIKDIKKVPPGYYVTLRKGGLVVEKYYSPIPKVEKISFNEAKSKVRQTVEEAVQRQMVADVPVGVYLSGGIDSSSILAAASKVKKNIKTFSVGFDLDDVEESDKFNRDFELARETAKHFGAEHHELILNSRSVAESLEEVIGSMDDPISNPTAIAMYHLAKFSKQHVTVVLSGNGGDELFGGYERYRMSRRVDIIGRIPFIKYFLPIKIRKALEMSALDRLAQFEFEKDHRLSKVIKSDSFYPMDRVKGSFARYVSAGDKTESLMMADLQSWLPDQALLLGDKMSMQGSLEERVPLLDCEVVDLALSLPISYKVNPFETKKILKDAFKNILPGQLFKEPKRGWFSPGAKWLRREDIQSVVRKVLSPEYYSATAGLFKWGDIRKMFEDHIEKREYNLTILWMIITFQIWAKKHSIKYE
jgi:asparagine synthase (glutamine-hydrolysing)